MRRFSLYRWMTLALAAMSLVVLIFSQAIGISWGQGFFGLLALGLLFLIGILWTAITIAAKYLDIELKKPIWISTVFVITPYAVFLYVFYRIMAGVMLARNYPGETGIIIASLLLIGGTAAVGKLLKGTGTVATAGGSPKDIATAMIIISLVTMAWGVVDANLTREQYFNPISGNSLVKFCDICNREFRGEKAEKYVFCPFDHHELHTLTPENLEKARAAGRLPQKESLINLLTQRKSKLGWGGTFFLAVFGAILTTIPRFRFVGIVIGGVVLISIFHLVL